MRYLVALGISLGVHALGFRVVRDIGRAPQQRSPPSPEAIDVVIAEGDPAPPQTAAIAAPPRPPRARRRATSRAAAVVARASGPGAPIALPSVAPRAENAEDTEPAGSVPAVGTVSASPSDPSAARSSLDLRPFFQRLQAAAQRCAGSREGHARVRFCVDGSGRPTDISLVQSSGNFALDDAALHCVLPGSAPLPLTDRCLVVPLVFR